MKKHMLGLIGAALAVAVFVAGDGFAQDLKVGFVDFQKFAGKSHKAKEQQQKFAQFVDAKRTSLENKKKEIENLKEQLTKTGAMLKDDARNQKIKEIGIKEMEFQLAEKEAQNDLQNEQRDQQEIFRRDISKIITALRAEKNLQFIFDSAALLSADDSLEMTDEVVRRYDADTGSGAPATRPKPAGGPASGAAPAPAAAPKPKPAK
jgi:outer membrane protein